MKQCMLQGTSVLFAVIVSAGLTLGGISAAWAQQKQKIAYKLPAEASKFTQQHVLDVGDVPGHQVRIYEVHRTYPKDMLVVEGVRSDDEGDIELACVVGEQPIEIGLVGRRVEPGFLKQPAGCFHLLGRGFAQGDDPSRVARLKHLPDVVAGHPARPDDTRSNSVGHVELLCSSVGRRNRLTAAGRRVRR